MRRMITPVLLVGLLIAGCGRSSEPEKTASMQAEVTTLKTELERQNARNDTLMDQLRDAEDRIRELRTERDELQARVLKLEREARPEAPPATGETEALKQRISELESEIATLKEAPPEATPDSGPEIDTESIWQELEELMPMVKAGDMTAIGKMQAHLDGANKEIRDSYITRMRDWVKQEPENKHARVALAMALTSRFRDLKNPMDQGALAGQVKEETLKALEIDPEYYEAQHFLAILQSSYPAFTPEFKTADVQLDRALALQAKMTWEDRFAEIYAAYGRWYRQQKKFDEAAAKVQAGLDLAPRNQGLLDEQQRIEDARNQEGQ